VGSAAGSLIGRSVRDWMPALAGVGIARPGYPGSLERKEAFLHNP
jgi:hypothetical protein